jgi:hypothetical protein
MRRWLTITGTALLLSILVVARYGMNSPEVDERQLFTAELEAELRAQGLFLTAELSTATPGQLWLLAHFGPEAYLAGKKYPEETVTLYLLFGQTPEFAAALAHYGYQQVVPVVWHYFTHASISLEIRSKVAEAIASVQTAYATRTLPSFAALTSSLPPEERAWLALNRILAERNDFLGRFAIGEDGVAHPILLNRVFAVSKDVLAGNLISLERKYRLGEEITAHDIAGAGLDVAFLGLLGAKTLALLKSEQALTEVGKTAEVAKVAQQGKRISVLARTPVLASVVARAKVTRYGLAGVGLYMLFTHPAAFTAGVGTLAEALGVPRWCGQLAAWMTIWMVLLWLVSMVLLPIFKYLVFPLLRWAREWMGTSREHSAKPQGVS